MKLIRYMVLSLLAVLSLTVQAQQDAQEVVANTTKRVTDIIAQAKGYYDQDPQRFYSEIETVLGDVLDFDSFARGVMGKYASSDLYRSLKTDEEKALLRQRVKRFSEVFKQGLIQTYAKGLLAFDGNNIEVLPVEQNGDNAVVLQRIHGAAEKPYEVYYKMRRDRDGAWRLRNVTIEAINLGQVYQSQFYQAMKQYNEDMDKTIDNWSVDPTAQAAAEPRA